MIRMSNIKLVKCIDIFFGALNLVSIVVVLYYLYCVFFIGNVGGIKDAKYMMLHDFITIIMPVLSSIYALILINIRIVNKTQVQKSFISTFVIVTPWLYWLLFFIAFVSIASL
jgi:hypothetical protein